MIQNNQNKGDTMKTQFKKLLYISIIILLIPAAAMGNRLIQERGIYPNQSAEYVRTLNRSASTDVDAAFYNPAGLAFLDGTGLYIMLSGQTYWAKKTHSMDYYAIQLGDHDTEMTYHTKDTFTGNMPKEYFAETLAPILPDLDIVYKGKTNGHEWVLYLDISLLQAAPEMKFPLGLAILDWGNLAEQETLLFGSDRIFEAYNADAEATRTEYVIGGTLGASYKINKWLSVALGGRYIYAMGSMDIQVKNISYTIDGTTNPGSNWNISTSYEGHGGSIIAGFHMNFKKSDAPKIFRPLDIGFKVEYHFPIVMKKINHSFLAPASVEASGALNLFKDGSSSDQMAYLSGNGESSFTFQYPTQFNLGISYRFLKNFRVEASAEITLRRARDLSGEEDDYNDIGFKGGLTIEWGFLKNAVISIGYLYNDFGLKDELRDAADMMLPSHSVGGGLTIMLTKNMSFTFGVYYEIYVSNSLYTTEFTNVTDPTYHYIYKEFNENRMSVAWGITYRFLGESDSKKNKNKKRKLNI